MGSVPGYLQVSRLVSAQRVSRLPLHYSQSLVVIGTTIAGYVIQTETAAGQTRIVE